MSYAIFVAKSISVYNFSNCSFIKWMLFLYPRVMVVGQKFAGTADKKEEWYGVDYNIQVQDEEMEAKWREPEANEALKLPEPNAFIPHKFELCERDSNQTPVPRIIKVLITFSN